MEYYYNINRVFACKYVIDDSYGVYRLMKDGKSVDGTIIDVTQDVFDDDAGRSHFVFYYTYVFNTPNGEDIQSSGSAEGKIPERLQNASRLQAIAERVIYLPYNPHINILADNLPDSKWSLLIRKGILIVLILIVTGWISYVYLNYRVKNYHSKPTHLVN